MDHRITIGAGDQRLATVALNRAGRAARPASASFRVVNLRVREDQPGRELASGAAVLDNAAAELGGKAGQGTADAQRLQLTTPPVGFVPGRRYVIQQGARKESFVLEDLDDEGLRTKTPLTLRYGEGAQVLGLEVACTFPAAVADSEALDLEAIYAVDWDFADELRDTRELISLERLGRARIGSVAGVYAIDQGLATYVGERRKVADALEQANRELLAELAINHEGQLELGDIGNLAAEYSALALLYRPLGPAHGEMAKHAHERARYYLDNLRFGDKPRGVVETDIGTDTAKQPKPGRLFRRA